MTSRTIRVGLLGCGHVGGPLVALISKDADVIEQRTGIRLELSKIAVRSLSKPREVSLDSGLLTTDAQSVATDDDVDVVVELIGGIEPARTLILDAFAAGKPVISGNKELIANCGPELFDAADAAGVDFLFEAAVAGAIPIIRPFRESLIGERIQRIVGIVNGTTNFILSKMESDGSSYLDALATAQGLGYAERDPTADVEGHDAAAKIAILATIGFGAAVSAGEVYVEGISQITPTEIEFASRLEYSVKLLAIAEQHDDGAIAVRVHPAMVPNSHPLAGVRDSFNAVFVENKSAGSLMWYGRGAGGYPSASAVLGDLLDAARNTTLSSYGQFGHLEHAQIMPIDASSSAYYVNMEVSDSPGVLSKVAGVFGEHGVSIRSMEQEGLGDGARLVFITHEANEADVQRTIAALDSIGVGKVMSMLRVFSEQTG